MIRRAALTLLICFTSMEVMGKEPVPPQLTSCVGRQYLIAKPDAPADTVGATRTCHTLRNIAVCRVRLDDTHEDNSTMKVMVLSSGAVIQEWSESADPAYFDQMHVLVNRQAKGAVPTVIVATQQAESQGMGVQEWAINVLTLPDPVTRRSFTTSELGPEGFVVAKSHQIGSSCKLLLTQWESRKTAAGERLFLNLYLADPSLSVQRMDPIKRLRFNKRLEGLRQADSPDRPLRYMRRDQPGPGTAR